MGEEAVDLGGVAVLGQQGAAVGGRVERVVGRAVPEVEGEADRELVGAELEQVFAPVDGLAGHLDAVEGVRRKEHRGDDVAEGGDVHAVGGRVHVVAVEGDLGVGQRTAMGEVAEPADELIEAGLVVAGIAIGGAGADDAVAPRLARDELRGGRFGEVVLAIDVSLAHRLIEAGMVGAAVLR